MEMSFPETSGDAAEVSNSLPSAATILTMQTALVEGRSCFTNVSASGPLASELLPDLHTTFQDMMSQQDLHELLINSIIDDPDGWMVDLVEHPPERFDRQEFRVFSFSLDPERYVSTYLLTQNGLIPPELSQLGDLAAEFIADIEKNLIMDWKIWVHVDDGYIYREEMKNNLRGAIDGYDMPELGAWLEIGVTGNSDIYYSDHDQLSDADFVLPCLPLGIEPTIEPTRVAPVAPTPAGAVPGRSR